MRTLAVTSAIRPGHGGVRHGSTSADGGSPLALTAVAAGQKSATSTAGSPLSLGSAASVSVVRAVSAASTLAVTQAAEPWNETFGAAARWTIFGTRRTWRSCGRCRPRRPCLGPDGADGAALVLGRPDADPDRPATSTIADRHLPPDLRGAARRGERGSAARRRGPARRFRFSSRPRWCG